MISLLLCQLQSKGVIVKEISICHLLAACDVLSGNYEINARLLFLKKEARKSTRALPGQQGGPRFKPYLNLTQADAGKVKRDQLALNRR